MTKVALRGKPYAGNPHVRFDEGEVALAATPRRGSLLYKASSLISLSVAVAVCAVAFGGDLELQPIPAVAPRPSVPLKFLTFNIWGDYFNNPVGERESGVETSILKVRPDVVSFQEVTPNWYKSPMFANLEKAGYVLVRGDEDAALRRGYWGQTP